MVWTSPEADRAVGPDFVRGVEQTDLPAGFRPVLAGGWVVIDGAVLLKSWFESYHGHRSRFTEVIDYEAAVNGRAIPDLDLVETGRARLPLLLRRGVAFANAALHRQHAQFPEIRMAAYVSASATLMDAAHFTGNVNFCSAPPEHPPYLDIENVADDIVIALFTEDPLTTHHDSS